jgi:hypothetical protein
MTELYAPEAYREASPEVRDQIINGCGPGGWKLDLISDTIWGLDISEACNIHDWMYTMGRTAFDKRHADAVFYENLLLLINAEPSNWFMKGLRLRRAKNYYEAVACFGHPAFWKGKK